MNLKACLPLLLGAILAVSAPKGRAQADSTGPATVAGREALHTESPERRVDDILKRLAHSDAAKTSRVRTTLLLQYRTLRARDEAISARLKAQGKAPPDDYAARAEWRRKHSQPMPAAPGDHQRPPERRRLRRGAGRQGTGGEESPAPPGS